VKTKNKKQKKITKCVTASSGLHDQPPQQISKGDSNEKKGIQLKQHFSLNSYPKVICVVYSRANPGI
jgi:hypothetical protein